MHLFIEFVNNINKYIGRETWEIFQTILMKTTWEPTMYEYTWDHIWILGPIYDLEVGSDTSKVSIWDTTWVPT